jgi:diguanylate cyclase (GGDEF)-like protein/PAS domain S-box-containing protein
MEDCQIPVSGSYSLIRNGRQDEYLFTRITEALNNERLSEELRHMLLVSLDELRNTRHHIQAGRDQWLSALDAINAPVFLLDRDYRVVSANIEYAKCAGMEIRDIIGKPYWHVFPRMDGPSEGRPGGMHKSLEIIEELTLPTGQVFYDHGYTVYDDADRAQYSLHILEDITEREQDEQTLRNLNRGLLTLRQVKRALTHSTEENALCNEVCRILAEDGGYRFVWIAYAEQDGGKPVRPVAWSDDGEGYLDRILAGGHDNEYGHEPTQSVVRSGLPMVINDIAAHPEYTSWREWASKRGFSSVMVLPLSDGSRCIGALNIYSTEPDAFAAETQSLIMEMAGDLATGIAALRHRSGVSDHQSQMRALIQHNPDAVLILDATGNIQFANPAAGDLLGRPVSALIGTPLGLPMTMGETTEIDILSHRDDGTIEPRIAELRLVKNDFAETPGTLAFLHDVTARNKAEQFTTRMGHILEHLWNEIYTINADTLKFVDVSAAAQQRLGYTLDELQRMTPMDIKPEFTREAYETMIEPLREGQAQEIYFEAEQRSKDGTLYPVEVRLQLSREEYPPVFIAIIQDNSERRRHLAELEHKALYDTLTDLPNRRLLQDRLDQSLTRARQETTSCAVLLITVMDLSEINDLMGYQNGDRVLVVVSSRLQDVCRESDTLARLGNNEFVIILPGATPESVKLVAWKIQKTFESPIVIDELPLEVEVATGIALYPDHGVDTDTLLKHGYIAMRAAENDANGVSVYNQAPYTLARLKLHGELRRAIENNEMTVFCQPKVDIKSGHIMGVEALARWQHPLEGMISPADFIPMVEQSGLIRPFTRWVIEEAIVQLRNWKADGIELSIAVNLSTRNLLDPELPGTIAELLEQYQVSACNLCLEITESALMSRPEQALKVLKRLHEMGAKLSIDDFGTGYSSLAYLKKLPVDELKIDQSFIFGLIDNEDDAVIVRSTIELAHNLGLRVVAEGVESKAVMEKLKIENCDIAQGYYLSWPLPRAELQQWLHTSPWGLQGTTLRMLDNGKI